MISTLLSALAAFIIWGISSLGLAGIAIMMAIESACIPLPSEIIMPFSGYLVHQGRFSLWGTAIAGALGCVLGSMVAYGVGRWRGRNFILKYGKFFLISHHDVELADRWFARYGQWAVFFSRLLPVIRTFISLPAGIAEMRFDLFILWTFVGSLPWCYGLSYLGMKMGEEWETLGTYFHRFDAVIGVIIVAGTIWWVRRHMRHLKKNPLPSCDS